MKIDQLTVKNFKGLENKEFNFSPQFNVLNGDNGSGKTAVLDALAVGIGALFLGFDGISSRNIQPYEIRSMGYQIGEQFKLEPQPPTIVHCSGEVFGSLMSWERDLSGINRGTTRKNSKTIIAKAKVLQEKVRSGDESLILPVLSYYGTGRLFLQKPKRTKIIKSKSRLAEYEGCLEPASDEKQFLQWIKLMELTALQEKRTLRTLEGLKQAVKECLEGCKSIFFNFQRDELITILDDGQIFPAHMLSDGQRIILAMVADIAYKAASLNPQLEDKAASETPGVVLIDEIDLHLHPNWQRKIVGDLKRTFPKIQFIVTTHSPFIIQSLRDGELINLNESEPAEYEDKNIEDIAEHNMGVEIPQRSQRYLDMMEAAKEYYRIDTCQQCFDSNGKPILRNKPINL
ncbi:AAA family ATPase [Candidatus Parabeggiatoa sp. HSG14]|uniref:AAA family ATPase n=1 Tax=Candidatus Parabeggiatoa sp. HSG14 TaxID=3055593 RepID=UPI0025A69337|nr:AAA family ATPase [Thiotrichales bacterium HSG14]